MSNTSEIQIVDAGDEHVEGLTKLVNILGYATAQKQFNNRFTHIKNNSDYKTCVALIENNITGFIGMQKGIFYELDGLYVRILALAVDPAYQRQSIGLRLMQEAEIWAKEIKASRLILNCGNRNERMNAHLFYAAIGFTASSTGYTKTL